MGEVGNAFIVVVGNHRRIVPFGRTKSRWKDKFNMELKERGYERVDWVYLTSTLFILHYLIDLMDPH
jgi:hypothetical protein